MTTQTFKFMTLPKWGAAASFLLVVALLVAPLIYLTGNLRDALGPFSYAIADFLAGPVWAASLLTAILALREQLGEHAPRRMSMALLAAALAAGLMLLVACLRAANRQYHLAHPDLHLENSLEVLTVWTTLVAGITGAAWHCLGWALVLVGWAGWNSDRLPRLLCGLYLAGGLVALCVYAFPALEAVAASFGLVWGLWQGISLWKA